MLLNDVVGLDGDVLLLSFKFVIDVLVVVCFCVFGLVILIVVFVGILLGVKRGFLLWGGDVFECFVSVDLVVFDKMGILIEGCFSVVGVVIV